MSLMILLILMVVLVSEGSGTSRTPVRNKQTLRLICLFTPKHPGRVRTVQELSHTSTINENTVP